MKTLRANGKWSNVFVFLYFKEIKTLYFKKVSMETWISNRNGEKKICKSKHGSMVFFMSVSPSCNLFINYIPSSYIRDCTHMDLWRRLIRETHRKDTDTQIMSFVETLLFFVNSGWFCDLILKDVSRITFINQTEPKQKGFMH